MDPQESGLASSSAGIYMNISVSGSTPPFFDGSETELRLGDFFNIDEIQTLQDTFAASTGVASIITDTQGTPITRPSNFCHLCNDIIRNTKIGRENCYKSDAVLGRKHPGGAIMQCCLSGGLWDAGTSICVGDRHVANWLIGQIMDSSTNEEQMMDYARVIGANEGEYKEALKSVTRMPLEQFVNICKFLHVLGKQLSDLAYTNLQQARLIAKQKKAEEDLRRSEEKFRSVVDASPTAMILVKLTPENELKIMGANGAAFATGTISREKCVGLPIEEGLPVTGLVNYLELCRQVALKELGPQTFEFTQAPRAFTVGVFCIAVRQIAITWMDITEKKRAEDALRESEEKYSMAFRLTPDAIVIARISDGTYVEANEGFFTITGYKREEVLGPTASHINLWTNEEDHKRFYREIVENGEVRGLETTIRRKDDSIVIGMLSARLIHLKGEACTLTVARDITERKRLEDHYRQVQKMEAVGQLAGGVAHDFNNILAAAMLKISLLKEEQELEDRIKELVNELEEDVQRAANLTRQLLLFGRRQYMQANPMDLNESIEKLLKMLRRLIGENIKLIFSTFSDPICINADATMIDQLIVNLCVNARDAMPRGGQISIETRMVDLPAGSPLLDADTKPGSFACISVTDTGCGMNEELRNHIFEPFFTTKDTGKGTGLGLATVHGIVKQHKGWIRVESTLGMGSKFLIYIPLFFAKKTPLHGAGPMLRQAQGTETVLLVEDEDSVRRAASLCMKRAGYTVVEASNAILALEAWKTHDTTIDLLLTDMVMPESMNGLELAAALRTMKPDLKIIVTSGYNTEILSSSDKNLRGISYLPKPYTMNNLLTEVRRSLDLKVSL